MNPDTITLSTPSKSFAYETLSRDIENINDNSVLKDMLRCYVKLYFKQQETMSSIGLSPIQNENL
jgi:hypothetical protein